MSRLEMTSPSDRWLTNKSQFMSQDTGSAHFYDCFRNIARCKLKATERGYG